MKKRIIAGGALAAALAVAALAVTVGAVARSGATPLPASSCSAIQNGSGKVLVASDLPLQGAIRKQTVEISQAMLWELKHAGWAAGKYKIAYQSCDDSTAQTGGWDTAKCATNAHLYASNRSVIAVEGTFNSGCAKIEVPIENRAGPLLMVSPANTNPGLTKHW